MSAVSSKILIVDDEAHIVELARLYLTREGYEVEGVGDGAQALTRFGQLKPDLVVLDIMLPGVDGLTICKEIRKVSQVPIIMLTARDEVTDKVVGLEVGADDYLTKPFHPQELVAIRPLRWHCRLPLADTQIRMRPAGPAGNRRR